MPMLLIRCPKTQVPISTGIDVPRDIKASKIEKQTIAICGACLKKHVWSGKNAFFEDGTKLVDDKKKK